MEKEKVQTTIEAEVNIGTQFNIFSIVNNGSGKRSEQKKENPLCENESLVDGLKPIFMGDRNAVVDFLNDILDKRPPEVVDITNNYRRKNLISELSCHRPLWELLHENGLYEPLEANWNAGMRKL